MERSKEQGLDVEQVRRFVMPVAGNLPVSTTDMHTALDALARGVWRFEEKAGGRDARISVIEAALLLAYLAGRGQA